MSDKPEKTPQITKDFLLALPKTDLHVHLDGSVRIPTLIELAREYHVELPSYTEAGLRELVFKERYKDLGDYLTGFKYMTGVLQSEPGLERVAYELAVDNQAEGVRYVEARFAPQLHVHRHLNPINVMRAVDRGMRRARDEFNARPEVVNGQEPPFEYGIIVCAMRAFREGFSEYYTDLLRAHQFTPTNQVFGLASLELARAAVRVRDDYGLPIVGLDLAGEEKGYPPDDHRHAYAYAHRNFMKKTVHAGEAYGPESIFQAITECYADRIGHGYFLLDTSMVTDPAIKDREKYVRNLSEYIADRRITIEVCLTSNLQTIPQLKDLTQHSFNKLREARLSTTLCTDNRTVSSTSVTNELDLAVRYCGVDTRVLKSIIIYGFKRSFFPGSYLVKRRYVRQIIDYYEKIERRFLGTTAEGAP
ncbi:MAG: adenosine deaminase family protein [Deltaproteobacteria bacterium]|nr:adenosine deaminase family protein [Deltaproteobacteria bacterium]